MDEPSTETKFGKMVELIEAQMAALRDEIRGRLETNYALWKMGLIGIGAIVVLKRETVLQDYLPLVPVLGITLLFISVKQNLILFRLGRSIALCECRINTLFGDEILHHEIELWHSRKRVFHRWRLLLLVCLALTPLHLLLMRLYMAGSKLGTSWQVFGPVYAASALIEMLLILDFVRIWRLLELPRIDVLDVTPS